MRLIIKTWKNQATGFDPAIVAQVKANAAKLDQIAPNPGSTVAPLSQGVLISTSDSGVVAVANPTGAAIAVPPNPTVADLLAAGLTVSSNQEAVSNAGALTGAAPAGIKVGVDKTTGEIYYTDAAGNWQKSPLGSPSDTVVLASLPSDTVTAIPTSTKVPNPKTVTVFDSAGVNITDSIVVTKTTLTSSRPWTDLQIYLEA